MKHSALFLIEVDNVVRKLQHMSGSDPEGGKVNLHVGERLRHLFTEPSIDQGAVRVGPPLTCQENSPASRRYNDVTVDRRRIEHSRGVSFLDDAREQRDA
jgi:hypothetical protein